MDLRPRRSCILNCERDRIQNDFLGRWVDQFRKIMKFVEPLTAVPCLAGLDLCDADLGIAEFRVCRIYWYAIEAPRYRMVRRSIGIRGGPARSVVKPADL